jgi:hypothetical protein
MVTTCWHSAIPVVPRLNPACWWTTKVRRTLVDLDEVEKELKKAVKAIDVASGLTGKYRVRLQSLCDNALAPKMPPMSERSTAGSASEEIA